MGNGFPKKGELEVSNLAKTFRFSHSQDRSDLELQGPVGLTSGPQVGILEENKSYHSLNNTKYI